MLGEVSLDTGLILAFLGYLIARLELVQKIQNKIKMALLHVHPELGEVFK